MSVVLQVLQQGVGTFTRCPPMIAALPGLIVLVPASKNREAGLQRAIKQIWLGETEFRSRCRLPMLAAAPSGLAEPQEVIGAVCEPYEGSGEPADAAVKPMLFLPFSLTFKVKSTVPAFSSR